MLLTAVCAVGLNCPPSNTVICCYLFHFNSFFLLCRSRMYIQHHQGCVLTSPENFPLVHCISFDAKLGAGAAKSINQRYRLRDIIRNSPRTCPGVVPVRRGPRIIVNLITKLNFWDRPNPDQMFLALLELEKYINLNNISVFACTVLGCGKDKFDYNMLLHFLDVIFGQTNLVIHMYHF